MRWTGVVPRRRRPASRPTRRTSQTWFAGGLLVVCLFFEGKEEWGGLRCCSCVRAPSLFVGRVGPGGVRQRAAAAAVVLCEREARRDFCPAPRKEAACERERELLRAPTWRAVVGRQRPTRASRWLKRSCCTDEGQAQDDSVSEGTGRGRPGVLPRSTEQRPPPPGEALQAKRRAVAATHTPKDARPRALLPLPHS